MEAKMGDFYVTLKQGKCTQSGQVFSRTVERFFCFSQRVQTCNKATATNVKQLEKQIGAIIHNEAPLKDCYIMFGNTSMSEFNLAQLLYLIVSNAILV